MTATKERKKVPKSPEFIDPSDKEQGPKKHQVMEKTLLQRQE